jgi:hypothetical protein
MDESTSIFWAREMRGIWSRASRVAPRAAMRLTRSPLVAGWTRQISHWSLRSRSVSVVSGGRTLRTRSAWAHRVSASAQMEAPTASKSASARCAPRPAPAWSETSKPILMSLATVCGVPATRRSPGWISAGIAIRIDSSSAFSTTDRLCTGTHAGVRTFEFRIRPAETAPVGGCIAIGIRGQDFRISN